MATIRLVKPVTGQVVVEEDDRASGARSHVWQALRNDGMAKLAFWIRENHPGLSRVQEQIVLDMEREAKAGYQLYSPADAFVEVS